jgi:hypothetical protein
LTSLELPTSVTSIGEDAFRGCTGLTSIKISNSVNSIASRAFFYCSGLTTLEIPNTITNIGSAAFYGCSGITQIKIPNSVTSIGDLAFYKVSSSATVTFSCDSSELPPDFILMHKDLRLLPRNLSFVSLSGDTYNIVIPPEYKTDNIRDSLLQMVAEKMNESIENIDLFGTCILFKTKPQ